MKTRQIFAPHILAVFTLALVLASCGGGGGGSGSGGRQSKGIRVLHGAIDGTPLQVTSASDPSKVLAVSKFAQNVADVSLASGDSQLRLVGDRDTILVTPLSNEGGRQTILVYGLSESGLHYSAFYDHVENIPDQMSAIRVIHGTTGASSLELHTDSPALSAEASFGGASDYVLVNSGLRDLDVTSSSGGSVFHGPFELKPGKIYSLFISGEIDYFVASKLLED